MTPFLLTSATGHRIATPNSVFLIHGPVVSQKTPEDYASIMMDFYTQGLREHTALPKEWFPLDADAIHVLNASDALKYELVDTIESKSKGSDDGI